MGQVSQTGQHHLQCFLDKAEQPQQGQTFISSMWSWRTWLLPHYFSQPRTSISSLLLFNHVVLLVLSILFIIKCKSSDPDGLEAALPAFPIRSPSGSHTHVAGTQLVGASSVSFQVHWHRKLDVKQRRDFIQDNQYEMKASQRVVQLTSHQHLPYNSSIFENQNNIETMEICKL